MSDLALSLLRVGLAALIGGVWVSFATATANLRGTRFGGTIGGLPSTSGFSFLFIGLNQSPQVATDATKAFPLALSFTILFLIVYAYTVPKGPSVALFISILVWLGFSIPSAAYNFKDFPLEVITLGIVSAVAFLVFGNMKLFPTKGGTARPGGREALRRGLVGGAVVGTVVLLSQELGSTWGRTFAAFPGDFSLTLLFTYKTRGGGVLPCDGQTLDDCGPCNSFSYSVIVVLAFPLYGAWLRTGLGLLCVAPIA